jgi:hypothetical protein
MVSELGTERKALLSESGFSGFKDERDYGVRKNGRESRMKNSELWKAEDVSRMGRMRHVGFPGS